MAPFSKIETIAEEAEEGEEAEAVADAVGKLSLSSGTEDEEVADWVKSVLERKRAGLIAPATKPALHAAPLQSPTASPVVGAGGMLE